MTWVANGVAFVKEFKYLQANVRETGSCISIITASSSLSTVADCTSLILPEVVDNS